MTPTKLLPEIRAVVSRVFGEAGILVARGGRYTPEQLAYADAVAGVLCGRPNDKVAVGLIEAETGIGKSLGYLVPALALIALKNNSRRTPESRVVVSTFTRALQRQIMEGDLPLAASLVEEAGLMPPTWAFRMGREAFWSPARTESCVETLKAEHPRRNDKALVAAWDKMLRTARDSERTGSGLWLDYLADHGRWPEGVSSKDVCLVPDAAADNEPYEAHKVAATNAQLVVTNHASLLLSINRDGMLGDKWDAMIVDESHALVRAAESNSTTRLQPREIARVAIKVAAVFPGLRRPKHLEDVAIALDHTLKGNRKARDFEFNDSGVDPAIAGLATEAQRLVTELHKACAQRVKQGERSRDQAAVVADLASLRASLERWNGTSKYLKRGVAYSPVRSIPSLMTASSFPGRMVRGLLGKRTPVALFTSATMSDSLRESDRFISFRQETGVTDDEVVAELRLSPARYGMLDFVISASDTPTPFLPAQDDEGSALDPTWVRHCAGMVREAMSSGKTLVLTNSFAETRALCAQLGNDGVLEHIAGSSIGEYIAHFQEGNDQVLVSPGAWEGVSLQTKRGGQLISNLVITRIPFASPDHGMDALRREMIMSRGYSASAADGFLHVRRTIQACQRLRQGIGRAIRGPSHRVVVWFCDPRMPSPGSPSRHTPLLGAIPSRFLGKYAAARIFVGAGKTTARRTVMRGGK